MKPTGERRQVIGGDEALQQLRDLGGRLEYVVRWYRRMVADADDGRILPELKDSVELMNGQLGYVARRLQELLVQEYEANHGFSETDEAQVSQPVALAR